MKNFLEFINDSVKNEHIHEPLIDPINSILDCLINMFDSYEIYENDRGLFDTYPFWKIDSGSMIVIGNLDSKLYVSIINELHFYKKDILEALDLEIKIEYQLAGQRFENNKGLITISY